MRLLILGLADDVRGAALAGAAGDAPDDRRALQRALARASDDLVLVMPELAALLPPGADAIVVPKGVDDADLGQRGRGRSRRT